ncbi:MAG TPA: ABC transporter C-terminal domain-containing protein, partial [Luteolibacter sp.]|nr:ABC transporter C-terminal domain-containing protein [Luteolibacter sp.]
PKAATASKPIASASSPTPTPSLNRKDQRRQEAEARELRSKVLKPLEAEFEALELKIAELEKGQADWTAKLSDPSVVGTADQFRHTSNQVAKIAASLETAYGNWSALSEEIERIKARIGDP